jgi:hypothetical protein
MAIEIENPTEHINDQNAQAGKPKIIGSIDPVSKNHGTDATGKKTKRNFNHLGNVEPVI